MSTLLELLGSAPTAALPVALTLSGHEQTPVTRVTATQGDGLVGVYRDSSIGVWEATTNLVTNGGFETNTTGHAGNVGTETVSRITTDSKFGAACLSAITPGSVTGEGYRTNSIAISAATAYAASFWFKAPIGATLTAAFQNRDGADAFIVNIASNTTLVGDGNWQRVTLAGTSDAGAANTRMSLVTRTSAQAITILIDGVQIEAQPLATPYVHTDGGTASRSAASPRIPATIIKRFINENTSWVAMRWKMPWASALVPTTDPRAFWWGVNDDRITMDFGATGISLLSDTTTNRVATQAGTFVANEEITVIGAWVPATVYASLNGAAPNTAARNSEIPDIGEAFDIGYRSDTGGSHADATLLFMAMGKGTLSIANYAAIHNIARYNRIDSRPEDLPGGCTFKWPSENWREGMAL